MVFIIIFRSLLLLPLPLFFPFPSPSLPSSSLSLLYLHLPFNSTISSSFFSSPLIWIFSGDLFTCGYNEDGQLGFGNMTRYSAGITNFVPGAVVGAKIPKFSRIFCGSYHSMALTGDGDLYLWGWNYFGQLSNFKKISHLSPSSRPPLSALSSLPILPFHPLFTSSLPLSLPSLPL
jgi:hypothetical protein